MSLIQISVAAVLLVRVYHTSTISVEDRTMAQQHAGGLLRTAGVAVTWVDCSGRPAGTPSLVLPCGRPPGPLDIVLRLDAAAPLGSAPGQTLGVAAVTGGGTFPVLSTVYRDRVVALAQEAGVDHRPVLGRAMAHEIAHLLLNSTTHAERGLMRPWWSTSELQRNVASDWIFTRRERDAMVRAVLERAASAARQVGPPGQAA